MKIASGLGPDLQGCWLHVASMLIVLQCWARGKLMRRTLYVSAPVTCILGANQAPDRPQDSAS